MKPHLIVQLVRGASAPQVAHWANAVGEQHPVEALHAAVDGVLRAWGVPVAVTREYQPAQQSWSPDEVAAGLDRVYRLVLRENRAIPEGLVDDLRLLPVVERVRVGAVSASPLPRATAMAAGPQVGWETRKAIGLDRARAVTRGHRSVLVAVIDTGVAQRHPELAQVLVPGRDFVDIIDGHGEFLGDFLEADEDPEDEVGHGTHVAGIIAGRGLAMPPGVAPRCRVLPVRALGAMRRGDERVGAGLVDNINNAIKWAVDQGADVINASLGIPHTGGGLPHEEVVRYALRRGVTLVAAAGNDGQDKLYYPGALPGVIAVGAFDESGEVAPFSTFGEQVMLLAPGENVWSSFREGGYAFSSGTSQAAPFVSGAIALLKSLGLERAGRKLSDSELKAVLQQSSDKVDNHFKHHKAGFGRLNLVDALRLALHRIESSAAMSREERRSA